MSNLIFPAIILACGGPLPAAPAQTGTALFESDDQISTFSATDSGFSWDRRTLHDATVTHLADITGPLSGNIETDARVATAISSTSAGLVEISASGLTPIDNTRGTFGAALDANLHWQVLEYAGGTMTLWSESSPGVFAQSGSITASCGAPEMLDVVAEDDGTVVARCAAKAIIFSNTAASLVDLPVPAMGLGRSSTNTATFVGVGDDAVSVIPMNRTSDGWSAGVPIAGGAVNDGENAAYFIVADENDFLAVSSAQGVWALHNDGSTWQTSQRFYPDALLSAHGSPLAVLSGDVNLLLSKQIASGWQTVTLAQIGIPAKPVPRGGCDESGKSSLWIAALIAATLAARRRLSLASGVVAGPRHTPHR